MTNFITRIVQIAAFAATVAATSAASAGGEPTGVWIDHTGRGAVEITPMGDRLKVMGYMGSKMLSETMTWRRAPADLKRCGA